MARMYFWSTERLADDLAKDRLTPREKMQYLLTGQAMYVLFVSAPLLPCPDINWILIVELALVLAITVLGILRCYQNNGGAAEHGLLEFFICLTVPLFIKVIVLFWGIYAAFFWLTGPFVAKLPADYHPALYSFYEISTSLVVVATTAFFYWRMAHHVRSIRQTQIGQHGARKERPKKSRR